MKREDGACAGRPTGGRQLARVLIALLLFGVSFGYVEACVVVYLRVVYEPLHERIHPDRPKADLFPLLRVEQLESAGPPYLRLLLTELVREGATLVMLAAVALSVARNRREWLAGFVIAFGLWDLFFYLFLKVLLNWPESLWTWDLLFLLPVPWVAPVLAPALVALAMIGAGVLVLGREALGHPVHLGWIRGTAIGAGGLLQVFAFCWDWRNTLAGGEPNPFQWPLFAFGGVLGLGVALHASWANRRGGGISAVCAPRPTDQPTAASVECPAPLGSCPQACSSD